MTTCLDPFPVGRLHIHPISSHAGGLNPVIREGRDARGATRSRRSLGITHPAIAGGTDRADTSLDAPRLNLARNHACPTAQLPQTAFFTKF